MNGKKAKALRRKVYGDYSLKAKRDYVGVSATGKEGKRVFAGVVNRGKRAKYQLLKNPEAYGALFAVNG